MSFFLFLLLDVCVVGLFRHDRSSSAAELGGRGREGERERALAAGKLPLFLCVECRNGGARIVPKQTPHARFR